MKNIYSLPVAALMFFILGACSQKTTIVWNEGVPDEATGVAVHELLICQ